MHWSVFFKISSPQKRITVQSINNNFLSILLKITGISILTEFAIAICKDSGESAIASKIDLGGKITIIGVSIPIITGLLETLLSLL